MEAIAQGESQAMTMSREELEEAERAIEFVRLRIAKAKAVASEQDAEPLDDIELALRWIAKKLATLPQHRDQAADQ